MKERKNKNGAFSVARWLNVSARWFKPNPNAQLGRRQTYRLDVSICRSSNTNIPGTRRALDTGERWLDGPVGSQFEGYETGDTLLQNVVVRGMGNAVTATYNYHWR